MGFSVGASAGSLPKPCSVHKHSPIAFLPVLMSHVPLLPLTSLPMEGSFPNVVPTHLPSRDRDSSGHFGSPHEGHGAGSGGVGRAVPGGDGAELSLEVQTGVAGLGHRGGRKGSAGQRNCRRRGEKGPVVLRKTWRVCGRKTGSRSRRRQVRGGLEGQVVGLSPLLGLEYCQGADPLTWGLCVGGRSI